MRPHDEAWRTKAGEGETACAVYGADGAMLADLRLRGEYAAESARARLMSAAPDMARALLNHGQVDVRGVWHSRKCVALGREALCSNECATDRAALTKAGVL